MPFKTNFDGYRVTRVTHGNFNCRNLEVSALRGYHCARLYADDLSRTSKRVERSSNIVNIVTWNVQSGMEIFLPDSNIDDSFFLFFFFLINLFTHRYTLQAAFFSKNRKCFFVRFIRILNSRKNILRIWFFLLKEIIRGIIREIFKDIFDMTISFLYACWSSIFFTINLFIHPLSLSLYGKPETANQFRNDTRTISIDAPTHLFGKKDGDPSAI